MLYHCATNYVFINLVVDKQTRVMHVTDWRYEKGKLFQAINLFSLHRMCLLPEKLCDQNFVFLISDRFGLRWKNWGATKNAFLYCCYQFILWSQDRVLNYDKSSASRIHSMNIYVFYLGEKIISYFIAFTA